MLQNKEIYFCHNWSISININDKKLNHVRLTNNVVLFAENEDT